MLDKKTLKEIQEYEAAGINVVAVSESGQIAYSTSKTCDNKYCYGCDALRLMPDPDPTDFFRDEDMKAVCLKVNGVIIRHLERPSEFTKITKPLYCPCLGRALTKEEEVKAKDALDWARKQMG